MVLVLQLVDNRCDYNDCYHLPQVRINLKFALEHPDEIKRLKQEEVGERKTQRTAPPPDRGELVTLLKRLAGIVIDQHYLQRHRRKILWKDMKI